MLLDFFINFYIVSAKWITTRMQPWTHTFSMGLYKQYGVRLCMLYHVFPWVCYPSPIYLEIFIQIYAVPLVRLVRVHVTMIWFERWCATFFFWTEGKETAHVYVCAYKEKGLLISVFDSRGGISAQFRYKYLVLKFNHWATDFSIFHWVSF